MAADSNIAALLGQGVSALRQTSDSPRLDAELILCHVLDQDRAFIYTWPDRSVATAQTGQFHGLIAQRKRGVPIAHILGYREFWTLKLEVDDSTLIPRPETELLVELALERVDASVASVLDLGTGTGAIALALASERPDWQILAVDMVPEAVALAERNRRRLGFGNVRVAISDWFAAVPQATFDLIIANPPYVAADDPHLRQGDLRFEPASALVAEHAGFSALEKIIAESVDFLAPAGYLLLEHGFQQAGEVCRALGAAGLVAVATHRDHQGLDRASIARMP